jgi:hypothetical protein
VERMGKRWIAIQQKINRAASSCRYKYRERAKATARASVRARERASALEVRAKMTEENGHHNDNSPDNTPVANELRGADVLTYKMRSANLCNMLAHGQGILQTPQKPTKQNKNRIRKKKILINDKRVRHSLHLWRGANGMTAHHGFVKKSSKVLFGDTRHHQSFDIHPFFHTIPYACIRETLGKQPFVELRCLEKEILELLQGSTKKAYTSHKYGANEGINCSMSFTAGETLSNKDSGISGTVQWSAFNKGRPDLRQRLCNLFKIILQEAFGSCLWYNRLLHLSATINSDSEYKRKLSGLPLTGLWFNIVPKQKALHCDQNVAGATFVLSTYEGDGASLVLSTTSPKNVGKLQINPLMILAGRWADYAHFNTNVATVSTRKSWTLYLDKRAFSTS